MSGEMQRIAEEQEDQERRFASGEDVIVSAEGLKELRQQLTSAQTRNEMQANEIERLQGIVNRLYCPSCRNTGWIDSDGNCGNCHLGRAKGEREELKEQVAALLKDQEAARTGAIEEIADYLDEIGAIYETIDGHEMVGDIMGDVVSCHAAGDAVRALLGLKGESNDGN